MKPGEILTAPGELELNKGRNPITIEVANTGDRPIQVGSHYHFFETNDALAFDRKRAKGMRLDIAAGTAVRFEPGQSRTVRLTPYMGGREAHGFRVPGNGGAQRGARGQQVVGVGAEVDRQIVPHLSGLLRPERARGHPGRGPGALIRGGQASPDIERLHLLDRPP